MESIPGLLTSLKISSQLSGFSPEKCYALHSANRRPGKLHLVTFSHTVHFVSTYTVFLPLLSSSTSCGSVRNIENYSFPSFMLCSLRQTVNFEKRLVLFGRNSPVNERSSGTGSDLDQ